MKSLKDTGHDMAYRAAFGVCYAVSSLPLAVHYVFSLLLSLILYHVVGYRRRLVRRNIAASFPQMGFRKRWLIERRFYLYFCDLMVEALKYFSISRKSMRKRMVFKGVEQVEDSCRRGRSCGILLGHFGNWEWVSSLPLWIDPSVGRCVQLYHPLENRLLDRLMSHVRERMGGTNVPVNESVRHLVRLRAEGTPLVIGFIADQAPFWNNIHYWTTFLNHPDTPLFTGPERLMRKFDMDVYYLDMRRTRRGHYTAEFRLLTREPDRCQEFEITEMYTRALEETIRRQPPYWLWSHNRWKRTKAEWERIIDPVTGKMVLD